MTRIRVGVRLILSEVWQGGYNYLLNLCRVMEEFKQSEIAMVLFAGEDADSCDLQPFRELLGDRVVVDPAFKYSTMRKRQLLGCWRRSDHVGERVLVRHNIRTVFENADFYGRRFPLATIAWMPDFQHKHLPALISRSQRFRREIGFRLQIATGRTLMVSSQDAKRDLQRFYGVPAQRVCAVPFALPVPASPHPNALETIRERYGLPDKFLICPNQFHPHKNHSNLVNAVVELARSGSPVTIICPGGDGYGIGVGTLEKIRQYVKAQNAEELVRLPGRVSSEDLHSLFFSSAGLINPSLFEGWSTTVEEAKAIGLPMLLSNLGVNREQAAEKATYFDPHDISSMSECIREFYRRPPTDRPNTETLNDQATHRLRRFADSFESTVRQSIANM